MAQLIVQADAVRRALITQALADEGHTLHPSSSSANAPTTPEVDLIIAPAELLTQVGRGAARILITDLPSSEAARQATECGAYDWLGSAIDPARVVFVTRQALAARDRRREVIRLVERTDADAITGSSALAAELRRACERAATVHGPVLLTGPRGAAPDRIARSIHAQSERRAGPFVEFFCGVLPPAFAEAELELRIARATGGTLYLDDVGALAPGAQALIRKTLDEDVRVIVSTSRDLVAAEHVRPDLAARLGERTIVVPALRARPEDLPALVERHLATHPRGVDGVMPVVTAPALAHLIAHDWPGDVRELETVLDRALALARGPRIEAGDLPFGERPTDDGGSASERSFFKASVAAFERDLLLNALRDAGGNRSRAAEVLGIYRRLLYAKIKEYGLEGFPHKVR